MSSESLFLIKSCASDFELHEEIIKDRVVIARTIGTAIFLIIIYPHLE